MVDPPLGTPAPKTFLGVDVGKSVRTMSSVNLLWKDDLCPVPPNRFYARRSIRVKRRRCV